MTVSPTFMLYLQNCSKMLLHTVGRSVNYERCGKVKHFLPFEASLLHWGVMCVCGDMCEDWNRCLLSCTVMAWC